MAKYLLQGSYSVEGNKGVLKSGGTARKVAIKSLVEGVGGQLECVYFSFGADDFVVICDVPDIVSAAALAVTVSASGAVSDLRTTVLLTSDDVDQLSKRRVQYSPPA